MKLHMLIRPEQCCEEHVPSHSVVVIKLPGLTGLESLQEAFRKYVSSDAAADRYGH